MNDRNVIRDLAELTGMTVDEILDMSMEDLHRRTLEVQAETAWLEAKIALLESIRDDVEPSLRRGELRLILGEGEDQEPS